MPEEKKRPDLQTFLTDPAFQGDRELFGGYIDHHFASKEVASAKKLLSDKKIDFTGKSDADILALAKTASAPAPDTKRSIFDW